MSVGFQFGLIFLSHDLFVSSFRLYDEAEHFALRRLSHSFVFFRECPSSRSVRRKAEVGV